MDILDQPHLPLDRQSEHLAEERDDDLQLNHAPVVVRLSLLTGARPGEVLADDGNNSTPRAGLWRKPGRTMRFRCQPRRCNYFGSCGTRLTMMPSISSRDAMGRDTASF